MTIHFALRGIIYNKTS